MTSDLAGEICELCLHTNRAEKGMKILVDDGLKKVLAGETTINEISPRHEDGVCVIVP